MFDWLKAISGIFSPNEYIKPKCLVCGGKMQDITGQDSRFSIPGLKVWKCTKCGFEYSPAAELKDKDKGGLIEKSKGDFHGEI